MKRAALFFAFLGAAYVFGLVMAARVASDNGWSFQ